MAEPERAGVTRRTMVETALRLLDEVGLDGLSVRRLATELGVRSPSLYWHVRSKQELLDGMADAIVVGATMGPPDDGETWQDWLTRRARAYRRSLLAHRDGARVVATASALSPSTVTAFNDELTALVDRGFPPVLALRTIATTTRYVHGFVLQEQSGPGQEAAPTDEQLTGLAAVLGGDPTAALVVAIRDGGGLLGEDVFEHGLRALVHGTEAELGTN
ncbi:MAG: TetR/AcrR family transcriptional regulator C-terminal domain-containing protein [Umezawaea sp.]